MLVSSTMLPRLDSSATDDESEDDGRIVPLPAPPTRLTRNVSGYDQRQDRLLVSLDSLVRESEPLYYRLLASCEAGNERRVRKMLQQLSVREASQLNPNKDAASYGLTSLHVASSAEVCALLVEHGVDVDVAGLNGQTPLHVHTHNNDAEIVSWLLDAGASVDAPTSYNGSTPLQWAVAADNKPIVQLLARAGANVAYANLTGNTALHMAASVDVARYLVSKGARADVANNAGRIPLEEAAARAATPEEHEVAVFLLDLSRKEFESASPPTTPIARELSYHSDMATPAEDRARAHILHFAAKHKWNLVKRAFLRGSGNAPKSMNPSSSSSSSSSGDSADKDDAEEEVRLSVAPQPRDFFETFFNLIVKERPTLALRVLDQQRKFLYWENTAQVFSYDTTLLGSVPHSSFALKEMVYLDAADLLSHKVVQYIVSCRWTLFTREMVFFEAGLHCLFCALLVGTSLTAERHMPLVAAVHGSPRALCVLLVHLALLALNLRYALVHVVQAQQTRSALDGSRESARRHHGSLWARVMHCRLRNESYYMVPHMLILASQLLRCLPAARAKAPQDEPGALVAADILCAVCIPRLFYRGLGFGEGLQSVGVAMATIRGMVSRNAVYFLVLGVLISGFSLAMAVLFRDEPDSEEYGSVAMAWMSLFMFEFNLDVGELNKETVLYRKWFAFATLAVYMVLVSLVVVNLLVAVMTNTYEEISRNSQAQWLLQRARLVVYFEHQELALHAILFGRAASQRALPPGPSKHYVKEVGERVLVELPRTYVQDLDAARRASRGCFHRSRDAVFRAWLWLRGARTFRWPTLAAQRQNKDDVFAKLAHSESPLGTLEGKADLEEVCAFKVPREEAAAEQERSCAQCAEVLAATQALLRQSKRVEGELQALRLRQGNGESSSRNGGAGVHKGSVSFQVHNNS